MILKGSQRAGAKQLAAHLLNTRDNDHVTVHEVAGFVADDLHGAFHEAHAISRGTRCKQFLFSLSLNPPGNENVPVDVFEQTIERVEDRLGLSGHSRAIVFHEKEGRRHAHCVWSRIDVTKMTAVNLPHFKRKLVSLSRELYLEHDWPLPPGLKNAAERDPLSLTLAEWQQAKRAKVDPRVLKQTFQQCWATSDGLTAFRSALLEHGLVLACGDRRGHVAVDWRGEVYAVSKWVGEKAKDVRAKLGDLDDMPSVAEAKKTIAKQSNQRLAKFGEEANQAFDAAMRGVNARRQKLVSKQREERLELKARQSERHGLETKARAAKLPSGLKALWFRLTGKYGAIKRENEAELAASQTRDQEEQQNLIEKHLAERQMLKSELRHEQSRHTRALTKLARLQQEVRTIASQGSESQSPKRRRHRNNRQSRREIGPG